jgi:hypothetical protein
MAGKYAPLSVTLRPNNSVNNRVQFTGIGYGRYVHNAVDKYGVPATLLNNDVHNLICSVYYKPLKDFSTN